jgi:hypothetical protein
MRTPSENLVGTSQLEVLAFHLLEALALVGCQPRTLTRVTLGLADTPTQCFAGAPEFLGDRSDRRLLRRVLAHVVKDHPDGAFTQFVSSGPNARDSSTYRSESHPFLGEPWPILFAA